jgi:hypothetical protein
MVAREIIDSDNEIDLMSLNKYLYKERRETNKTRETINPTYTIFSFTYGEPKYCMWYEKHKTLIRSDYH